MDINGFKAYKFEDLFLYENVCSRIEFCNHKNVDHRLKVHLNDYNIMEFYRRGKKRMLKNIALEKLHKFQMHKKYQRILEYCDFISNNDLDDNNNDNYE